MVVLYGTCCLPRVLEVVRRQPAELTRLLFSRVIHAHMQDSASRAPSGRRWSAALRRLSWIRYTRRSVVVRCPFRVVRCRVLGVRMYCIPLFLIWNVTQPLSLHSFLRLDVGSSVSPPAAVQDLDGGPY